MSAPLQCAAAAGDDMRIAQARVYFGKVGKHLGFASFEDYLETIPEIPEHLLEDDEDFPILLLIESRVKAQDLSQVVGIQYPWGIANQDFAPFAVEHTTDSEPRWIRLQTGAKFTGWSAEEARQLVEEDEFCSTMLMGAAAFLHCSDDFARDPISVVLPGSFWGEDEEEWTVTAEWTKKDDELIPTFATMRSARAFPFMGISSYRA